MSLVRDLNFKRLVKYSSKPVIENNFLTNRLIDYLFKAIENADSQLISEIENDLVTLGSKSIDSIVKYLNNPNVKVAGCAAMVLIRIGNESIPFIIDKFGYDQKYAWMIDFITSEITCNDNFIAMLDERNSVAS